MSNDTSAKTKPEAEAVADIMRASVTPQILTLTHDGQKAPVVLIPKGLEPIDAKRVLDRFREFPERPRGTMKAETLASFIAISKRHGHTSEGALFASNDARRIVAVFDYHRGTADPDDDGGRARWLEHRAVYSFPMDPGWAAWTAAQGKKLTQKAFAELLEARFDDLCDPTAATGAAERFGRRFTYASPSEAEELSRGLEVRLAGKIVNAVALGSGTSSLTFETSHKSSNGEPLKVPGALLLALAPFRGGPTYQVPVRLRYEADLATGAITWQVNLQSADLIQELALEEAFLRAASETGMPLFHGEPESSPA